MSRPYEGPLWLVYGLPSSSLGVRLLLSESEAQNYADQGFDVRKVVETRYVPALVPARSVRHTPK